MKHEKVKAFLDTLRKDPKAQEMIAKIPEPETHEGRIRAYEKIAGELGYDLSDTDLDAFIADREKFLQAKAKATAEKIGEIPENELEKAAGGGDHPTCHDTYQDEENCWHNDGCDHVYYNYPDYRCHYLESDNCNNMQQSWCGQNEYSVCGHDYVC